MDSPYIKSGYLQSNITSRIVEAALVVHKGIGPGFEEVINQRAIELELHAHGLEYAWEEWIDVHYRGVVGGKKRVDFIIEGVTGEIKAQSMLQPVAYVQALSYVKATGFKVGLLLNFGEPTLGIKRLAN